MQIVTEITLWLTETIKEILIDDVLFRCEKLY